MPPDQINQNYPVDYLDQIASSNSKPKFSPNRRKLLIIGGILAIILAVVLLLSVILNLNTSGKDSQRLAARLQSLSEIASDSQSNIKSSQLLSINSDLNLYLTNAVRDIADPLAAGGVNIERLDSSIVAEESGDELAAYFEDARLNAVFDRNYSREMAYQLEMVLILMQQIYNRTNNESMKSFLETSSQNLEPIQQRFSNFEVGSSYSILTSPVAIL